MTASPTVTTYRLDWQPYPYRINQLHLSLQLDPLRTTVQSRFSVSRLTEQPEPLVLQGEELELLSVSVNGQTWEPSQYELTEAELRLPLTERHNDIEIRNHCHPQANTSLMGLYVSGPHLFTQCEPEGFRRITWFADRPDVLTTYTVRLEADQTAYPLLLSNGNLIHTESLPDQRHAAVWEDPFPKPAYLFAIVAGDFDCRETTLQTQSGRDVLLQVYSDRGDYDKTQWAMESLIKALRWDEQRFNLELDLDRYMIVAARDFNMGAMENKGLNVFNSTYVLAQPQSTTDQSYRDIEAVIGHEYFHNWSGNRVTCRDWFQLSLKEGLTVFREQEFSADSMAQGLNADIADSARAVKRMDDVSTLRLAQFPEDAGPMAHPIRPESYEEISNFYTATIYEKGAEVIRMLHSLLGEDLFQAALADYFKRFDGQAITCDEFLQVLDEHYQTHNPGQSLAQFAYWYQQAGTPTVHVQTTYDRVTQRYTLTLSQDNPPVGIEPKDQPKPALLIPFKMALLDQTGQALTVQLGDRSQHEFLLLFTEPQQSWVFEQVPSEPVLSALRDFSAPVKLTLQYEPSTLLLLAQHDTNAFNRWEAMQCLARLAIAELVQSAEPDLASLPAVQALEAAWKSVLTDPSASALFKSRALRLPPVRELYTLRSPIEPLHLFQVRKKLETHLGQQLQATWQHCYQALYQPSASFNPDAVSAGQRALQNLALNYLCATQRTEAFTLAEQQYHAAQNMTESLGALQALVTHYPEHLTGQLRSHFYEIWQHDPLVIDHWFALQAMAPTTTVQSVRALMLHPAFNLLNPNRARALIFRFCASNPVAAHSSDGYDFWAEQVLALDQHNPEIAARLARTYDNWAQYAEPHRQQLQQCLSTVQQQARSVNVIEIITKALNS